MRIMVVQKGGYSNPLRGVELKYQEAAEVDDRLGAKLCHLGIAVPAPAPVIETTAVAPQETTAKRISKPRTRTAKR